MFCHAWLALATMALSTKFEVSISTHYKGMKGDTVLAGNAVTHWPMLMVGTSPAARLRYAACYSSTNHQPSSLADGIIAVESIRIQTRPSNCVDVLVSK